MRQIQKDRRQRLGRKRKGRKIKIYKIERDWGGGGKRGPRTLSGRRGMLNRPSIYSHMILHKMHCFNLIKPSCTCNIDIVCLGNAVVFSSGLDDHTLSTQSSL